MTPALHRHLGGAFADLDVNNSGAFIFTQADIPQLISLRPVATSNVDQAPVAPEAAAGSVALNFYGNFVADYTVEDNLAYVGKPI